MNDDCTEGLIRDLEAILGRYQFQVGVLNSACAGMCDGLEA